MKIAIIGFGKMGKRIHELLQDENIETIIVRTSDQLPKLINQVDVAIEFTRPDQAYHNIRFCLENDIPIVSGTTGWLNQLEEITEICTNNKGCFFYASNFSLGMNIVFEMNRKLAQLIPDGYTCLVEEIHHTSKKDSPSGTAITLAEGIIDSRKEFKTWHNNQINIDESLSILSKREEDVPGTHIISYENTIEKISLNHIAHSRDGFALGAISAAKWIIGKQGIFTMRDLLAF